MKSLLGTAYKHLRLHATRPLKAQPPPGAAAATTDTAATILRVTLARPKLHNAFNEEVVAELQACFAAIATRLDDPSLPETRPRAVVLAGEGPSFSAGADMQYMRAMADFPQQQNKRDAQQLFDMFHAVYRCPVPVIARVQGAALGGGAGLVAACDIAFATQGAVFGFTEASLGLLPAVISPFVLNRIDRSHAMRLFVTTERFRGEEAARIGLVHGHAPDEAGLDALVDACAHRIAANGPFAVRACKELVHHQAGGRALADPALRDHLTNEIARLRVSPEGQEGLLAFLEKRAPSWKHQ